MVSRWIFVCELGNELASRLHYFRKLISYVSTDDIWVTYWVKDCTKIHNISKYSLTFPVSACNLHLPRPAFLLFFHRHILSARLEVSVIEEMRRNTRCSFRESLMSRGRFSLGNFSGNASRFFELLGKHLKVVLKKRQLMTLLFCQTILLDKIVTTCILRRMFCILQINRTET